jgi:hypothetical protein
VKNEVWQFPNIPASLTGLTLEHVSQLQAKILQHGTVVGTAALGQVLCMKVQLPVEMLLFLIGPPEKSDLLIVKAEGQSLEDLITIQLNERTIRGRILWNPLITIADVLMVLDTVMVVTTTEISKSSTSGQN